MDDLLYLVHRIPYPPDKGDKIRSYHLLRHLARQYRVHVGAFVDDPDDWRHAEALGDMCADVLLRPLKPGPAKLKSLIGFVTGEALSLPYYRDRAMAAWVRGKLGQGIRRTVMYSSVMGQYVLDAPGIRVMDYVDMDSDKWRQYAANKRWPMSAVYRREADRLLDWERRVAAEFDAGLFVSEREAADFRAAAPEVADRIGWYNNGVDTDYFSPEGDYASPYPPGETALVFTGAMDYWPNADAVQWFARDILPRLRAARPEVVFTIVGSRPTPEVQALAQLPGVRVTGRVPDVRPYLAHAAVAVAPMRIARGIQNKVLEGMAMARPVVVSPQGYEGLSARPGEDLLLAGDADAFATQTLAALERPDLGARARQRVLDDYAWDSCLARVDALLAR